MLMCSWCCATLSAAQLQFAAQTIELTPAFGTQNVQARFTFHNAGSTPLTITDIEASCGCTTTALEKLTYQPNERGEIAVEFDTEGLGGLQDKTFQVFYDKGAMILLRLRVTLAEAPSISPTFLFWNVGDPNNEKVATMTFPKDVNEHPTEVVASSTVLTGKLYNRDDGTWVIAVTPTATTEATNVAFTIRTNLGRTLRVFGSVRK
jgi:hypothetical protein